MSDLPPLAEGLPWLGAPRAAFERALAERRLPHAVLLQIGPGQGGEWLARWLVARVYCPSVCGHCLSCRRVYAGEHPDLQLVMPEDSSEIRIEQVRTLSEQLSLTRHGAGRKTAIIAPADRLNRNAANALLKTLEEPHGETLLVLVTAEPARLPATIASRCLRMRVPPPSPEACLNWLRQRAAADVDWAAVLEIIGPAPLLAAQVDHARVLAIRSAVQGAWQQAVQGRLDPPVMAERWGKEDFAWYIAALERCARQSLRRQAMQGEAGQARQMLAFLEELQEARRWETTPINKSLVLQRLLWRLSAARPSLSQA